MPLPAIDPSIQQSIASAVTFAVATVIAAVQVNHDDNILSLRKLIKKSLLLKNSPSPTPLLNPDTASKALSSANTFPKALIEKWNQADLGYFNLHVDKAHGEGKLVSVGKDIYYKNVVLFVQCLQRLVTF